MKMLLPRRVNPMIKNLKVECPFDRFNLLPRHWHQHRIQVHRREPRQNLIGLCGCPRRRISKLAPKNQIRLTRQQIANRIFPLNIKIVSQSRTNILAVPRGEAFS